MTDDGSRREHSALAASLAALVHEHRDFVTRHEREHRAATMREGELRREVGTEIADVRAQVAKNTRWRHDRQAQERVGRYLIGSNVLLVIMAALAFVTLLFRMLGWL